MAEKQAETKSGNRISERQRFNYIGFDVFPGDPKDIFANDAERNKLIEAVRARRDRHDKLRAENSLLEERVSGIDRMVLTIASVLMIVALFFPFYSAYNERVEETRVRAKQEQQAAPIQQGTEVVGDENQPVNTGGAVDEGGMTEGENAGAAQATSPQVDVTTNQTALGNEEVITGFIPKKKFVKETSTVSALGAFAYMGDVFSAGGVLIIVGLVMLVYTLLCLAVPLYTLYGLYGLKGSSDDRALKLKGILRFGWLPILALLAAFVISLVGSGYGSSNASAFTSFGDYYHVGVFLTTLSWGVLISLIGSIMIAVKGIEI